MCKTSNKAARLQIMEQQKQADAQRAQNEALLAQQAQIHQENIRLQQEQTAFQREQSAAAAARDAEMLKLASRPTPLAASAPGTVITGGMDDGSGGEVTSRKKGRASLRIDLNSPQVAGNTGLNVPRG